MVVSVLLYAFTGHAYVKWLIRNLIWLLPIMCRAASLIIQHINIHWIELEVFGIWVYVVLLSINIQFGAAFDRFFFFSSSYSS